MSPDTILVAFASAFGGGTVRDVLCNEIPEVFHDHVPYTLCAFIGCSLFLGLRALGTAPQVSTAPGSSRRFPCGLQAVYDGSSACGRRLPRSLPAGRAGRLDRMNVA
jgi:uncharacterized membrane protein YeiH